MVEIFVGIHAKYFLKDAGSERVAGSLLNRTCLHIRNGHLNCKRPPGVLKFFFLLSPSSWSRDSETLPNKQTRVRLRIIYRPLAPIGDRLGAGWGSARCQLEK